MTLDIVKVGYLKTNCYLLKKDGFVLVIDPGDEYEKIKEKMEDNPLVAVIITHHHPDHVGALSYFPKEKVYDISNLNEGVHELFPFQFEILATPGHKSDAISIYFPEEKMMFTGDFLFCGSIGRTDFPTGSMDEMKESLRKVSCYDKAITLYPGHGIPSTLGIELEHTKSLWEER